MKKQIVSLFLYSHGNAADIGGMYGFMNFLHLNLKVNVLSYDYLGYGLTRNKELQPSEEKCYESIEACQKFLNEKMNISNKDIVIWGTSVGSGPSCHLAASNMFLGLILEAPFLSCIRVVYYSAAALRPFDMFVNSDKIGLVKCPVFILHGSQDQVINQQHGKELYSLVKAKYQYPPQWVEGANHNDILQVLTPEVFINEICKFLSYCEKNTQKLQQESPRSLYSVVDEEDSTSFGWSKIFSSLGSDNSDFSN